MIYKTINNENINEFEFTVNKQYVFENADLNIHKCEFNNSFPIDESYDKKYIDYVWLDSSFYKNFYIDKLKTYGKHNTHQYRRLGLYSNFIKIDNSIYNTWIHPSSIEISVGSHNLKDDSNGNIINADIVNHSLYDDFNNTLQEQLKYSILVYDFSNLKYYTENRLNGIVPTIEYIDNDITYDNNITDITGFNNNLTFVADDVTTEIYNDDVYIHLNNSDEYSILESDTLKDTFKNDFTIVLELNYINGVNGEISLLKRGNDTNILFEILFNSTTNKVIFRHTVKNNIIEIDVDLDLSVNITNPSIILQRIEDTFTLQVMTPTSNESNSVDISINANSAMYNNMNVDFKITTPQLPAYFNASIKRLSIYDQVFNITKFHKYKYTYDWFDNYFFGNVFYEYGIISITKSNVAKDLNDESIIITELLLKNTRVIYEHEYICTVNINDFNYTRNETTLKINTDEYVDNKIEYNIPNYITKTITTICAR